MVEFNKNRLASAVGVAVATGLAAPAGAVVVVGGDNGWEISFDGNINAFYTVGDYDQDYVLNGLEATGENFQKDSSRIHSGFLPAFFSFNAKSPTVNGLTGTARISFAPVIHTGGDQTNEFGRGINGNNTNGLQGASVDTREVVANISGDFGEISFGRTLSLFGRQAILNDMVLFGVGFEPGPNHFGSVTFGGVGHGYTYPEFAARIQYTTPNINGFQAAVGMFDPSILDGVSYQGRGFLDETDTPRFEGELSYANSFQGGDFKFWFDGTYQDIESTCNATVTINANTYNCSDDITVAGWGVGGNVAFSGFSVSGYYYDGNGLGVTQQFNAFSLTQDANGNLEEADTSGYYVQGTYTFNGKTKLGVRYGQSEHDGEGGTNPFLGGAEELQLDMWTVGVYHDVNSWLKLIAEFNQKGGYVDVGGDRLFEGEANTFSVGSFMFW